MSIPLIEEIDQLNQHLNMGLSGAGGKSSSPSGSADSGNQNPASNSGMSDEDQQTMDDRKQRRMLSNRESARRSRLRKQQHLDELRSHVAQLRAQNSHMLSSFSVTSKHFAQVMEENRILRSEAMELSNQLQGLHDAMVSQENCGGSTGCGSGGAEMFGWNQSPANRFI